MNFRIPISFTVALVVSVLACIGGGCSKGDLSTPKGAAKSFAKAMESGDAEAAKAASTGGDPKMIETMVKMSAAAKKLHDALVSKFGDKAGSALTNGTDFADMYKKIDEGTEQISGDTATLSTKGSGQQSIKLKKVNGDWKVDVAEMMGPAANMDPGMFDPIAKAYGDTADEVNAGKYKSASEAEQAMRQKMMGAMMGGGGGAKGGG